MISWPKRVTSIRCSLSPSVDHDSQYVVLYTYKWEPKKWRTNNKYRNTNDINDAEYRQMRKSEDSSYEYHGADAEDIDEANADNGYPEVVEHNESGSVYDLKTDFIVLLPDEIIRIPQDSNLAWMTMFYALPRELVEKRPAYLELPRNITLLLASEKHMKLIGEDTFLELV